MVSSGEGTELELSANSTTRLLRMLTKGNIADLALGAGLDARNSLQLQRRVVSEQHLRCILNSSPSGIDELLDEHLAKDTIRLLPENGAKDDSHTIVAGLDIDGFFLTIVDRHDIAALSYTLRCFLRGVLGCLFLEFVVFLVGGLERGGHGIALQERDLLDQLIAFLCAKSVTWYHKSLSRDMPFSAGRFSRSTKIEKS